MLKAVVGAVAAIGLAVSSFAETIELSTVTADRTLASGDVITGKLGANVKISIAAGAYVILRDATIDGANNASCKWAGLTCEGDASIYIDGENYVRGFYEDYPSIHVPEGKTLTIRQVVGTMGPYGDPLYGGTLTVPGNNYAAGIGAGNGIPCGNIVIESGIIRAAGKVAAGIGGANGAACGDITIKGGVVSATGGWTGAGIGGGGSAACGTITIEDGVTLVVAKAGSKCENPIGAGKDGTCGAVTVTLAEGATDMTDDNLPPTRTIEGTATAHQYANGVAWDFRIVDGEAEICDMYYTSGGEVHYSPAIDTGTTGALVIPDTLGGKPVTRIGNSAFSFCKKITSVTIPASVTSIGESTFQYCADLESATILGPVTDIGERAFEDCSKLAGVVLPESVTSIGEMAFKGCDGLTSVTIPGSVKSIGDGAFRDCHGLTSVTIMDGVETIGKEAFRDCDGLTSVTIPASVKTVEQEAFENCTSLATLNVSDGTAIELAAFYNCNALADANGFVIINNVLHQYVGGDANVTVPSGVTRIAGWAFASHNTLPSPLGEYPPLVSVTIPDSVTSIGQLAFSLCVDLEKVTFPAKMPSVEKGAFYLCTKLADADGFIIVGGILHSYIGNASTLAIPDGVTSIGQQSFMTYTGKSPQYYWTSPVTCLTFPSGVTNIDIYAFAYCPGLTTVSIPKTLTSIGDGAFYEMLLAGSVPLQTVHVEAGDTERVKGLLLASKHPVDGITFIEDYLLPVNPDPDPGPDPDPDPGPCYERLEPGDITAPFAAPKAVTLAGVVFDGCDVAGLVELKLGKVNAKKGTGKVSGTVTTLDGKKHTIKSFTVTEIDGENPKTVSLDVKDFGKMSVTVGGTQFAGSMDGYHVQSADVGGNWAGADAVVTVDADDLSMFAGKVLSGLLPAEETATVKNGKWTFAKAAAVKWAKPKKGAALPDIYDDESGKGLIIDDTKGKTNKSGLKLAYTPKKGTFRGSFKVYALEGAGKATKLKKYTVNVNGFVVNGVGHGQATCKKPAASWPVTVR